MNSNRIPPTKALKSVTVPSERSPEARKRSAPPIASPPKSKTQPEPLQLLHQLQVHQVELELQNAELRDVRNRIEVLLESYTDLYDFAPVGYLTLGADGAIQMVNLAGAKLLGVERKELVGRPFDLYLKGPLRPLFQTFLKKVLCSQARVSTEFELQSTGSEVRAIRLDAQQLSSGRACRMAVMDLTARRQAEERVRASEIRYRRLFEAAQDGVLLLDPANGKITDANPFMTRLLGYSRAELIGRELYEIGLLKDERASQQMFRRLKRTRKVRYENLPLEGRDGSHQEVEVVANLYDEGGHSVIQCNVRDISERKRAEAVVRQNQELFSALVAQAPVGVYVVDSQLRMVQINPRARPAFEGIRPLIGRPLAELVSLIWPPRVALEVLNRFRRTLDSGEPYQSLEFTRRRKDLGHMESYEWQIERIHLPNSEWGVVCFFNNTTQRKAAEAAHRRLEVLSASNLKLAHEISQRQAVEAHLTRSKQHQGELLEASRRMQAELRQHSRQLLRAQEEERKLISRDLHDVIAQTLTGINLRLAGLKQDAALGRSGLDRRITQTQRLVEKSVDIVHQFARDLRPAVLDDLGLIPALHSYLKTYFTRTGIRADLTAHATVEQLGGPKRTVLYRVAQEALTNVSKHAAASQVTLVLEPHVNGVSLSIHDNGKSFSVERTLSSGKCRRLGLLGMRERVEMVGGTLSIDSRPGFGTTVLAVIPSDSRPQAKRASGRASRVSATPTKAP